MSFESDFVGLCTAHQPLTDIVGENVIPSHDRDGLAAKPEPKFIIYQRVFTDPRNTLEGNTSGAERVRLQCDCYDDDFDVVVAMANALRAAIPAYGLTLHGLCINVFDQGIEPNTRLFRRTVEFSMFYAP